MTNIYICSLFLFLISTVAFSQNNDCKQFKVGSFYYPMIKKDANSTIRTKSKQVSYNKKSDMTLTWKMDWINDCGYEMTLKKIKNNGGIYSVGDKIIVQIVNIEGKCYYFDATFYSKKYPKGKKFPQGKLCKE